MNRIQKISSYLLVVFGVLLIAVPSIYIIQWAFIGTKTSDLPAGIINFLEMFEQIIRTPEGYVNLRNVSWIPSLKLLGFIADIIGLLPFLISLFILKDIFKNYQKGAVFSIRNPILYRRLGILFLADAVIIEPLSHTLMVIAVTFTSPPGHRYITVGFGTPNLTALFYGILIIIVSWVMLEASKLHDEQKFTI